LIDFRFSFRRRIISLDFRHCLHFRLITPPLMLITTPPRQREARRATRCCFACDAQCGAPAYAIAPRAAPCCAAADSCHFAIADYLIAAIDCHTFAAYFHAAAFAIFIAAADFFIFARYASLRRHFHFAFATPFRFDAADISLPI
jgi:hypothetical protein